MCVCTFVSLPCPRVTREGGGGEWTCQCVSGYASAVSRRFAGAGVVSCSSAAVPGAQKGGGAEFTPGWRTSEYLHVSPILPSLSRTANMVV